MGNIVTPDQGLLPLPAYSGIGTYRKSLRERFFGSSSSNGRQNVYVGKDQHFTTAPLPPVLPYAIHNVEDDFYGDINPYVTAAAMSADNEAFESGSEFISEEEVRSQIQILPELTVTTDNATAERITDNPTSRQIVTSGTSLFQQDVENEKQQNIYSYRPVSLEILHFENKKLRKQLSIISDDGSTTSEMSGHDSESIYETNRVFTPRKQPLPPLEDEDEYKTAGVDEVDFEIKDLVRLQKGDAKNTGQYNNIISSTNIFRQHPPPRVSSLPSSPTINMLLQTNPQHDQNKVVSDEEDTQQTVTERIKNHEIQNKISSSWTTS
ncbi:unnamed protein product [Rotaria sp. Silwood2]|nr:unnamed protein product [Rotaria sp. Silwood2]